MPTIRQIADRFVRSISGGSNTQGNKYEMPYIEALVPQIRAKGIRLMHNGGVLPYSRVTMPGTGRFSPLWYQTFEINIVAADQDSTLDHLVFDIPAPIFINDRKDGRVYLGEKKNANNFKKAFSKDEISTLKMRGWINGQYIVAMAVGSQTEVYGNLSLKKLYHQGILDNPADASNFDILADYPVSEDLLDIMEDIFKGEMGLAMKLPKDTTADNTETIERAAIKSNIV